jgi:hypothetical protein
MESTRSGRRETRVAHRETQRRRDAIRSVNWSSTVKNQRCIDLVIKQKITEIVDR